MFENNMRHHDHNTQHSTARHNTQHSTAQYPAHHSIHTTQHTISQHDIEYRSTAQNNQEKHGTTCKQYTARHNISRTLTYLALHTHLVMLHAWIGIIDRIALLSRVSVLRCARQSTTMSRRASSPDRARASPCTT